MANSVPVTKKIRHQKHHKSDVHSWLLRCTSAANSQTKSLLPLLNLIQKNPCHHDMRSNSKTVSAKSWVEFEGTSSCKCLHSTVHRSRVGVFTIRARLHLLYLSLHIIKRKTACWCKEPRNSTSTCVKPFCDFQVIYVGWIRSTLLCNNSLLRFKTINFLLFIYQSMNPSIISYPSKWEYLQSSWNPEKIQCSDHMMQACPYWEPWPELQSDPHPSTMPTHPPPS